MNEHDNLTPAEWESYSSALKEAYPQPKTDIHGRVMAQIKAERLAEKKKARRAAFVKWGSVAACLLLVCMVALKVVPEMDKLAPMAENNADYAEDISVASYNGIGGEAYEPNKAQAYSEEYDAVQNGAVSAYCYVPENSYTVDYGTNGTVTPEDLVVGTQSTAMNGLDEDAPSSPSNVLDSPEYQPMTEAPEACAPETEADAISAESEETEETEETEAAAETAAPLAE